MSEKNIFMISRYEESWIDNIKENKFHFIKGNCIIPKISVFIIGAGPSLKKNVNQLKLIPKYSTGKIMAVDISLPYLYKNGIIPDYCISIDSDGRLFRMMDELENIDTTNIILLCSVNACPDLVNEWKGPKYFFMNHVDNKIFEDRMISNTKTYKIDEDENIEIIFEGIYPEFYPRGNVTATAIQFIMKELNAWKIIFVGLDLSWSQASEFYVDNSNQMLGFERVNESKTILHKDINNNNVMTNISLFSFKKVHESYSEEYPNKFINSTEGGILGIDENGNKMDSIEFLTLKQAIKKYVLLDKEIV